MWQGARAQFLKIAIVYLVILIVLQASLILLSIEQLKRWRADPYGIVFLMAFAVFLGVVLPILIGIAFHEILKRRLVRK